MSKKVLIVKGWEAEVTPIEGVELVRISPELKAKRIEGQEERFYRNLCYRPDKLGKEFKQSIFSDDPIYDLIDLALVGNSGKYIKQIIEDRGEDAAKNLPAAFKAVEHLKEITAYKVEFEIPAKYKFISTDEAGEVKSRKTVEFADENDLTTLTKKEEAIEIKKFDYVLAYEPDGQDIRKTLLALGKIEKA